MGRILIVAVACILGALVTWLFVPTIQPAPVMRTAGADAPSTQPPEQQAAATPMMSEEKRHERAEQLVGGQIKYVPAEKVVGAGWFREQETQVIERAMDECFLLTDKFLYAEHVHALSDGGYEVADDPAAVWPHPSLKQLMTCKNVFTVYAELHGKTLDF